MIMKLTLEIEYDAVLTTPEAICDAMNTLLQNSLSTPDVLDEVGSPIVQDFEVL